MRLSIVDKLGFDGLVSLPYTSHNISQQSLSKEGFLISGLSLCDCPEMFGNGQRDGTVFTHRILDSAILSHRKVVVPIQLHSVMQQIYKSLNCVRDLSDCADGIDCHSLKPNGEELGIRVDPISNAAMVFLRCPSRIDEFFELISGNTYEKLSHISVSLDTANPKSYGAINRLLESRFIFSAVHPFAKTDLLTLQRISDLPGDIEKFVKLYPNQNESILNDIVDMQRVSVLRARAQASDS